MAERSTVPVTSRKWSPARTLLALLLLAMAAGQLSDVGGFAAILDTYRVFPGDGPTLAAWILIGSEAAAGVALLSHTRHGATLAVVVALAWTGLTTQAFARGLTIDNCGCFGIHLGQPLRWWVLIEDAEFIALAVWVLRGERRGSSSADEGSVGTRPSSPATRSGRGERFSAARRNSPARPAVPSGRPSRRSHEAK